MRRPHDMIGTSRLWLGLLGVSSIALLSGCGWFGGSPSTSQKVRPGADRLAVASGALPAANPGRQYEPGIAATDETRAPQIGSIVAAKGGQKAQKEAADKAAAEVEAKAREERQAREAAEREAKAKEAAATPPVRTTPGGSLPGRPAGAQSSNDEPATPAAPPRPCTPAPVTPEPAAPVAPAAPVTSAPVPPPAPEPARHRAPVGRAGARAPLPLLRLRHVPPIPTRPSNRNPVGRRPDRPRQWCRRSHRRLMRFRKDARQHRADAAPEPASAFAARATPPPVVAISACPPRRRTASALARSTGLEPPPVGCCRGKPRRPWLPPISAASCADERRARVVTAAAGPSSLAGRRVDRLPSLHVASRRSEQSLRTAARLDAAGTNRAVRGFRRYRATGGDDKRSRPRHLCRSQRSSLPR